MTPTNSLSSRQEPEKNDNAAILEIAKVMRTIDEAKVKDCKEDIDTLLVFVSYGSNCDSLSHTTGFRLYQAGLFSAVLTAFLIESYKNLQPDKAERTGKC